MKDYCPTEKIYTSVSIKVRRAPQACHLGGKVRQKYCAYEGCMKTIRVCVCVEYNNNVDSTIHLIHIAK